METFADRIAQCESTIIRYKELIPYYKRIGLDERIKGLYEDIEELEQEIEAIKAEQKVYRHNTL